MPIGLKRVGGMGMVTKLRRLVDDDGELYECRNCGTTVSNDRDECPTCGSTEIAHYEF